MQKLGNNMVFTQIQGIEKTYAHYLLFNKNSAVLRGVIESLRLDVDLYTPLLEQRNKEHITHALISFGQNSEKLQQELRDKLQELRDYAGNFDADNLSDSMKEHDATINLIHELVITNYPPSTITSTVADTREHLQRSLHLGYYGYYNGKLINNNEPPPHGDINAMNKYIVGLNKNKVLISNAKKHAASTTASLATTASKKSLDDNLSAVASLYADLNRTVAATSSKTRVDTNRQTTTTDVIFHGATRDVVHYTFILTDTTSIQIPTMDYGATITMNDGVSKGNRCFLLALAHGLGLDPVTFYTHILYLFKDQNSPGYNAYINKIGSTAISIVDIQNVMETTQNQNDILIYDTELLYLRLKESIEGNTYIDIYLFLRWVYITQVYDRGLVCLILNDKNMIDVHNPVDMNSVRNQYVKAGYDEQQITKIMDDANSTLVPIVGNLTTDSIVLINIHGGHFILGKMTDDMLATINAANVRATEYDNNGRDISVVKFMTFQPPEADNNMLKYGGGSRVLKRSLQKTKKRRGYRNSYKKTYRRSK